MSCCDDGALVDQCHSLPRCFGPVRACVHGPPPRMQPVHATATVPRRLIQISAAAKPQVIVVVAILAI